MNLRELAEAIPRWPAGHVNNRVAEDLDWWTLHARDALFWTLDDLQELNGLVARAHYLIANPPGPTGNATPPGGGSAGSGHATITPMRIAA